MADIDNLSIKISTTTGKAVSNVNKLVEALKNLNAQLDRIDPSRMQSCAQAAKDLGSAVQSVSSSKKALAEVSDAAKNLGDAIKGANDKINESGRVAGSSGASGAKEFANSVEKIGSAMLKSGWSGFTSTLKKAGSLFASIGKGALKAAKNIGHFGKSSHSAKGSLSKLVKELTRVGKMLKLMITRMVLRQVISGIGDGFKNLAQYSKSFDATLSTLWNSFRQLGNAIAAAASPLLTAFAPALNYIIQLAIKAVNAINQLVSALTGLGTWKKAKTLTDSYAASLDKANKSAKELKKTVLGFDELNQLQDNSNSGGGGASPADMFEESPISDKWKNWADKLKDMWAKADFTELGKELGEKLLEALESIPWNKIKANAYKIGKSLATLINGFIEVPKLGYTIGKSLAEAINTAVMLANGWVRNLHWDSLGKFIGETFNGFFENIDWYYIKDTFVAGLRGLASAIQNFIQTFHWDNISNTIVNALDAISSGIYAFFKGINWKDLGKRVGEQISKTIKETDWEQVGRAIGSVIQSAIDFVSNLLKQLDWSGIKKAITDLLKGFFEEADPEAIGKIIRVVLGLAITRGLLGMAATGVSVAAKTALSEAFKKAITSAAGGSTATTAATAAGTSIASYIFGGIVAFFGGVKVGKYIGEAIFPDDAELYQHYSGIKGTLLMLKDTVVSAYDLYIMKAEEWARNAKMVADLVKTAFELVVLKIKTEFTQMKGHVEMTFGEVTTKIKGKVAEIQQGVESFIAKVKSVFNKDNWTFSGVAEGLKSTFQKAKDSIAQIWNSIANKLNGEHGIGVGSFRINLPTFANGGFPEDGLFMANHGEMVGKFSNGKSAVANNEQITNGIAQAVFNAITSANGMGGGDRYINNTIVVDGEVLARTVTKGQDRLNRRYSPTMA